MMTDPPCLYCKHFTIPIPETGGPVCAAFPRGIPDPVWKWKTPHTRPIVGDGGLRYEVKPGLEQIAPTPTR